MNAITKRASGVATANALPVPNDPELLAAYFRQVESYQTDRLTAANRSRTLAWAVAGGACVLAAMACLAVAGLSPLKTVVPVVFRVDNATGIVDRVYDVRGGEMAASEAERRFFLWQYVRYRQGYSYHEAVTNFDAVNLMSTSQVQVEYASWFRGSNPASPQVTLGHDGMAVVRWVSTQFSPVNKKVAFVRFIQQERKGEQVFAPKHMIATIGFDFAHGTIASSAININPDGFLVTSYHADEEGQ